MRPRHLLPAALVLLALTGCTAGGTAEEPAAEGASAAPPGTADTTNGAALAEQTFDAGASGEEDDNPGGEITATLRSLEVAGETMTLRWAMRWDNDEAADDAAASLADLAADPSPRLTDTENLKQYFPLCAEGDWVGGGIPLMECRASALISPNYTLDEIPNHGTMEGWSVFAAPQDEGAVFDVLIADGWPTFTGVSAEERS